MDKELEYRKDLFDLYKKVNRAVTRCIEYCKYITRSEAIEFVLEEIFKSEDLYELSDFRKKLKDSIKYFLNEKMNVKKVEELLFK